MALYLGSTKAKSIKLGNTSVAFPPIGGSTPTEREFVRPNLTSNGTLGGSSFAVTANKDTNNAYKAVNGSTSGLPMNSWFPYDTSASYTVYNPNPLRVIGLKIKGAPNFNFDAIQGSDDNSSFTNLSYSVSTSGGGTSKTYTISFNNNNFYKYYKFILSATNSINLGFIDIAFTSAIEKVG